MDSLGMRIVEKMQMDKNIEFFSKVHADMDPTCYAALLKEWNYNDFSEDKLTLLRSSNTYYFSKVMTNDGEEMFDIMFNSIHFFDEVKELIERGAEDVYFSLNSFYKQEKNSNNVRHLNAIVMDFDFYKNPKYKNYTPKKFYDEVIKDRLPLNATYVIDSGRGLYVIYAFKHCSYHMSKLYKSIIDELYKRFGGYGMDPKAMNITQVIRVPGSINSKSMTEVTIIDSNDTNYTIQDLAAILPFTYEEAKSMKKKKESIVQEIYKKNLDARKKYFKSFFDDLKKIIQLRGPDIVGSREYILYICRDRAVWSGYTVAESIQFASKLNDLFKYPLTENELVNRSRPSKGSYKSSLDTIIKRLELSSEEMMQLKMLKTRAMKVASRQKLKRKHPLLNRTDAELKRLERRKEVLYLKLKERLNNSQIARKLDITRQTVIDDLKYVKSHPASFIKKLESYLKELEDYSKTSIFQKKELFNKQLKYLESLKNGYLLLEMIARKKALEPC